MNKIVVWLEEDYSKSSEIITDHDNRENITELVNSKFGKNNWFYYDIWELDKDGKEI